MRAGQVGSSWPGPQARIVASGELAVRDIDLTPRQALAEMVERAWMTGIHYRRPHDYIRGRCA